MPSFGVLESRHLEHVPGTVLLEPDDPEIQVVTTNFKRGEGKFAHPSSDPNDPLKFSSGKKLSILVTCCFGAILFAATTGPLLNAALELLVIEFGVSFTLVTQLCYRLSATGSWNYRAHCLSLRKELGQATHLSYLIAVWTYRRNHRFNHIIDQWFISRKNSASILDERRGLVASLVQFFIGTMTNLSTMITGVIATHLNWRYCFYFMAMCSGIQLIALFFLVPETSFHRTIGTEANQMDYEMGPKGSGTEMIEDLSAAQTMTNIPDSTYLEELAVFTGSHSDEPVFCLLIAPIVCCLNLAVMWVIFLGGGFAAFCIAPLYVMSQLFSAPPYGLTAEGVGFLNTGPLIGGILATLLLAVANDPIIGWASHRNRGIYEPEFRLMLLILGFTTGPGIIGFGYLAQRGDSYYATSACHGVAMFGVTVVAVLTSNYILDAYRNLSNEVFISSMMFKNFLLFGMSYSIKNVVSEKGPQYTFLWFGGAALVMMISEPFIYVLGKIYRSHWHRHNILGKWEIMTHAEL
ncbi:mfs transporter-like protein [Penicillium malachiteum]|nr:mfs transporter-like protein [Penicillium malachiteum]